MNELKGNNVLSLVTLLFVVVLAVYWLIRTSSIEPLTIELNLKNVLSHVEQLFQYWWSII